MFLVGINPLSTLTAISMTGHCLVVQDVINAHTHTHTHTHNLLRNMGDNAQADEFDQLLQKMTEGTYQPPDLEALPVRSL